MQTSNWHVFVWMVSSSASDQCRTLDQWRTTTESCQWILPVLQQTRSTRCQGNCLPSYTPALFTLTEPRTCNAVMQNLSTVHAMRHYRERCIW